ALPDPRARSPALHLRPVQRRRRLAPVRTRGRRAALDRSAMTMPTDDTRNPGPGPAPQLETAAPGTRSVGAGLPANGSAEDAGPPPKPPRWRRWAVEIGIFVAVSFAIPAWMARDVPAGPAPAFTPAAAGGRALSLPARRAAPPGAAVAGR